MGRILEKKLEAFVKLKVFKALTENQTGHKIKCIRSNGGWEFTLDEFTYFCDERGIKRQYTTVDTPQQNGHVEK